MVSLYRETIEIASLIVGFFEKRYLEAILFVDRGIKKKRYLEAILYFQSKYYGFVVSQNGRICLWSWDFSEKSTSRDIILAISALRFPFTTKRLKLHRWSWDFSMKGTSRWYYTFYRGIFWKKIPRGDSILSISALRFRFTTKWLKLRRWLWNFSKK